MIDYRCGGATMPLFGNTVNSLAESYVNSAVYFSPTFMSVSSVNLTELVTLSGDVMTIVSRGSGSVASNCIRYLGDEYSTSTFLLMSL